MVNTINLASLSVFDYQARSLCWLFAMNLIVLHYDRLVSQLKSHLIVMDVQLIDLYKSTQVSPMYRYPSLLRPLQ